MTPEEILAIDLKRNQPDYMTFQKSIGFINKTLKEGGKILRQGDTLMLFRNIGNNTVMFHSFSADKPANYLKNMAMFADMLKKMGFETAVTTYQNPKLSSMFKAAGFDATVIKTDDGYQAEVRL